MMHFLLLVKQYYALFSCLYQPIFFVVVSRALHCQITFTFCAHYTQSVVYLGDIIEALAMLNC
jgi:hypothetical protein